MNIVLSILILFAYYSIIDLTNVYAIDYTQIAENSNYTCDELIRWLGTEKHYSNSKKEVLFSLLAKLSTSCEKQPYLKLNDISFGSLKTKSKRTFFHNPMVLNNQNEKKSKITCANHNDYVIAYLSNFSINNNFSHFLHSLLRLFCVLIDTKIIIYDKFQNQFIQTRNYTIWLDEYFKLSNEKRIWLQSFGGTLILLNKLPNKGECISSNTLIYGSGCIRLLPPEKWFGYPGCRAGEILPAFGKYMRQKHMALNEIDLKLIDEDIITTHSRIDPGLRIAFAVRDVTAKTGMRIISNLEQVQNLITKTQHIRSSLENVTFEHLDVPSTIRYMASVHIFISVHGAGMTNMVIII